MSTYLEAAALNNDPEFRQRTIMCAKEQGALKLDGASPQEAALGAGVISGVQADLDAIIAQVCVAGAAGDITSDDLALLGAVQAVWAVTAAARYPQAA